MRGGRGGGGTIFIENFRRGGSPGGGGGGRGAGRVFAGNWVGGGGKYFFSGPKFPPRLECALGEFLPAKNRKNTRTHFLHEDCMQTMRNFRRGNFRRV